ncbi:MAG: DEAD/DEAH box helicase [Deltaproteobacteria bacterium]|nr:DEAD/DEAH box helicase [Deltaproteobacteria bacterium]
MSRTFGTVRLTRGTWEVEAEPHVAVRFKRVFGKVAIGARGAMRIGDTEENARDLAWFLDRYPMDVPDRKHLERRAMQHRARIEAIEGLVSGRYDPPEFALSRAPRRYQRIAAEVILRGGSLLVADDVGLGKTATAICTFTDGRTLPALVVTLAHLPRQWEQEIQTFAPALRTHVVKRAQPYELRGKDGRLPDVIITNYHKLHGWQDVLSSIVRSVVFDEAQELRHRGSAKYQAASRVARAANFRSGLSATPIYNFGGEIYNVLDALRPGCLGNHEEFLREWCDEDAGSGSPRIADPRAFGTWAREQGLILRRTRSEVGRELPQLIKIPHHVDADPHVLDRIGSSAAELSKMILGFSGITTLAEADRRAKFEASERLDAMLRQATGIAKAAFVADFVRLLVESGEKVVLFGWHREVYALWLDRLADLRPALYSGSESPTQKEESRRRFVEGETPILIMSLRAGAGLDGLQGICRTVVFGELDWSPGVHEQCVGRVHRDGQREPVAAYFLVAEHGSDPVIADVLQLKRQQVDGVRDPLGAIVEAIEPAGDRVKKLAENYLRQRGASAAHVGHPTQGAP